MQNKWDAFTLEELYDLEAKCFGARSSGIYDDIATEIDRRVNELGNSSVPLQKEGELPTLHDADGNMLTGRYIYE